MKVTLCKVGKHHELAPGMFVHLLARWNLFHSPTFTVPSKREAWNKSLEFGIAGAGVAEGGEGVIIEK